MKHQQIKKLLFCSVKCQMSNVKCSSRAFTLIELLVSLTIFSFVVVMAIGALYSAQNFSVKAQQSQVALDGFSFAMEVMSREIRYGTNFHCDTMATAPDVDQLTRSDCTVGKRIYFTTKGNRVAYYLEGTTIKKITFGTTNVIEDVTSSDIKIDNFNFYVKGAYANDNNQPRITVVIAGQTVPNNTNIKPTIFRMQNTISQRDLDN